MRECLVLVYGQPLSLKTTLAGDLARGLHIGLVSTGYFGRLRVRGEPTEFASARDQRYAGAIDIGRAYLLGGWSVVIEGTFAEQRWRKRALDLARELAVPVVAVYCHCHSKTELMRRQQARRNSQFDLDRDLEPYPAAGDYEVRKLAGAETSGIRQCSHYDVDTCAWRVCRSGDVKLAPEIAEALDIWVSRNRNAET